MLYNMMYYVEVRKVSSLHMDYISSHFLILKKLQFKNCYFYYKLLKMIKR